MNTVRLLLGVIILGLTINNIFETTNHIIIGNIFLIVCVYIYTYIYIYTHSIYSYYIPVISPDQTLKSPHRGCAQWLFTDATFRTMKTCTAEKSSTGHNGSIIFLRVVGKIWETPKKCGSVNVETITMEPSGCWWECEIDKKRSLAWFDHQQKAHESTKEGIRTQPEDKILIWVNWYPKNRRVHSKNDNFKASKSSIFQWWRIPHVGSKNPPETRGIIGIGSNKIFGANNSIWMSCLGNFGRRKHMCIYILHIYIY